MFTFPASIEGKLNSQNLNDAEALDSPGHLETFARNQLRNCQLAHGPQGLQTLHALRCISLEPY